MGNKIFKNKRATGGHRFRLGCSPRRVVITERLVAHPLLPMIDQGCDVIEGAECTVTVGATEVMMVFHGHVRAKAIGRRMDFHAAAGLPFTARSSNGRMFTFPNFGVDGVNVLNDTTECSAKMNYITTMFPLLRTRIQEMHGKGIAHCDLKLENVLWNGKTPTIIDFGAAVWIAREGPLVVQGAGADPRLDLGCMGFTPLPREICHLAMLPNGSTNMCPFAEEVTDHDKYAFGLMLRIALNMIKDPVLKKDSPSFAFWWSSAVDLMSSRERMQSAWETLASLPLEGQG